MRTYGRITNSDGSRSWIEVTTDPSGNNDAVYLTTLAQVLQLNLGESPFFANYGIPQYQTIVTQVFPDYYVIQTQSQFSGYFASLTIARQQGQTAPVYDVSITTHYGVSLNVEVPT